MHFDYTPLLIIGAFVVLAVLMMAIYQSTINRAIKKHIIPDLNKKGFVYRSYESTGLFDNGDFNKTLGRGYGSSLFSSGRGSIVNTFFFYIYYKTPSGNKRVTARIDTVFLAVRKVEYSHEL